MERDRKNSPHFFALADLSANDVRNLELDESRSGLGRRRLRQQSLAGPCSTVWSRF